MILIHIGLYILPVETKKNQVLSIVKCKDHLNADVGSDMKRLQFPIKFDAVRGTALQAREDCSACE